MQSNRQTIEGKQYPDRRHSLSLSPSALLQIPVTSNLQFQSTRRKRKFWATLKMLVRRIGKVNRQWKQTYHTQRAWCSVGDPDKGYMTSSECFAASGVEGQHTRKYECMRNSYEQGDFASFAAQTWHRTYFDNDDLYYSVGNYSTAMELLPPLVKDENGKLVREHHPRLHSPNLFSACVLPWTLHRVKKDSMENLRDWGNGLLIMQENRTEVGIVGFFYNPSMGAEITFAKNSGYMPSAVRGFFREVKSTDEPTSANQFQKKWFEIKVEWKKLAGSDIWVPERMLNRVFAVNRRSKQQLEVEITAAWKLAIDATVLSLANAQNAGLGEGKLAEIQSQLERAAHLQASN